MRNTLAPVTPPPAATPETGLVPTLAAIDGDGDWSRSGLTYVPEGPTGYRALADCAPPDEDLARLLGNPAAVEARPWTLEVPDACRARRGRDQDGATARVRRILLGQESYAVARELWTGEVHKVDEAADPELTPTPYLAGVDADNVLSAMPVSPRRALGMLQAAVGGALLGARAFIHVPPAAEPYLPDLSRTGALLTTRTGSLVIVDAGYPGTAPEAVTAAQDPATAWVYATGRVGLYRSDVEVVDEFDGTRNEVDLVARRRYATPFDPSALFAVPITLT